MGGFTTTITEAMSERDRHLSSARIPGNIT